MKDLIEDYHLHASSIDGARTYIDYLSRIAEEHGKEFKISFSQHDSFDFYHNFPLIDYGESLNIEIIPSITFVSKEGIESIIINPKENALKLLSYRIKKQCNRICNILYRLMDMKIYITPKKLLQSIGRSNMEDLYIIKDVDILNIMVEEEIEGCETIDSANSNYLSRANLKKLYPSFEEIINYLSDEDVSKPENLYIATPTLYLEYMQFLKDSQLRDLYNKCKQIKGIIIDPSKMVCELEDFFTSNEKEIKFGTGRTVD